MTVSSEIATLLPGSALNLHSVANVTCTFVQLLTPEERQEALYGTTVVHASFGDVEQAQMSLRGTEHILTFYLFLWSVISVTGISCRGPRVRPGFRGGPERQQDAEMEVCTTGTDTLPGSHQQCLCLCMSFKAPSQRTCRYCHSCGSLQEPSSKYERLCSQAEKKESLRRRGFQVHSSRGGTAFQNQILT